jgi:murein DD-endopeptidase MepM/ murein hydrolase activator NlpD
MNKKEFEEWSKARAASFHPVVPLAPGDRLLPMDFTAANTDLTVDVLLDTPSFSRYVEEKLSATGCRYGIGGYNEHRTIYQRSEVFDAEAGHEPRRLHLGIDVWGPAGTPVYAPIDATVHSLGFNSAFGDYGATLILRHKAEGMIFHTLYGHLDLLSIQNKNEGDPIAAGDLIARFGPPAENGYWPPHLHFQVILDMKEWKGDYPGVCAFSEREMYLENSPDPEPLLGTTKAQGR